MNALATGFYNLERGRGIEPLSLAWKARAQPLYQTRVILWCARRDSNSQNVDFESTMYTNFITSAIR
jgi:hypothetical protein